MESDELAGVVESLWTEVLHSELRRVESDEPSPVKARTVAATIHIEGASKRTLLVICSDGFARHIASIMFNVSPEEASDDDLSDAMGEVANIVGGNVKGALPAPTRLTLPEVRAADEACGGPAWSVPHALGQARFDFAGEPMIVAVTGS